MTISRVATDVANKGTTASATATYQSGILAGDIIVVTLGAFGNTSIPTLATPSGFTLIGGQSNAGSKLRSAHYWKIAAGTESGTLSIAITNGSGWAITLGVRRSTIGFGASAINSFSQANASALSLSTPALTGVPVGAWSQSAAVFSATDTSGATINGNGWSSDATASLLSAGASSASNSTRNGSVPQCNHAVSAQQTIIGCSYYITESNDTTVAATSSIAVTASAALTKPAAALAATASIAITSSAALTTGVRLAATALVTSQSVAISLMTAIQPQYRSSSSRSGTVTVTPIGTLPPLTQDGDFLIACVSSGRPITGAPAGWQLIDGPTIINAASQINAAIYTKTALGEPASWSWQTSGSSAALVQVVAVQYGTQIDGATSGFQVNPAVTRVEAAPVYPVEPHDLLVAFYINSNGSNGAAGFAPDPAMVEVQDQFNISLLVSTEVQQLTAAGFTDVRAATSPFAALNAGWLGAVCMFTPIAASATVTIQSSAALTTSSPIAATSLITILSSAQLTTVQPIAASALITFQSTANLTVGAGLAAAATITIVSNGGLGAQGAQLVSSALITFQTSADLTVATLFAADALITFQSTATLSAVGADLAASAVITFQSSADLTTQAAGAALAASALITIHSSASLTTGPVVVEVPRRGEKRVRFHAATDAIAQPKQARVQVQTHVVRTSYQKLQFDANPAVLQATVDVGGSAPQVMVSTCDVDAHAQAAHVDVSASSVNVGTVKNLTDEELLAVFIAARRRKKRMQADQPRRK